MNSLTINKIKELYYMNKTKVFKIDDENNLREFIVNKNNELIELREKQSFTTKRHEEHASVGIYYFANWDIFSKELKVVPSPLASISSSAIIQLD